MNNQLTVAKKKRVAGIMVKIKKMQGIISTKFLLRQTRNTIMSAFSYSQLYFSKFNYEWYAKQQSLMDCIHSIRSCTVTPLPKKHWKSARTSNPPAAAPPAPRNQVCRSDWQLLDVLDTTFPVGCLWHCLTSNRVLANGKIYECLFTIFCFIFKAKLLIGCFLQPIRFIPRPDA